MKAKLFGGMLLAALAVCGLGCNERWSATQAEFQAAVNGVLDGTTALIEVVLDIPQLVKDEVQDAVGNRV